MKMRIRPLIFFLWIRSQYYKTASIFKKGSPSKDHVYCTVNLTAKNSLK